MLGTTGHLLKIARSLNVLTKSVTPYVPRLNPKKILQILGDLSGPSQVPAKIVEGLIAPLKSSITFKCFPSQTEVNAVKKRRNTPSKQKLNCPAKIKLRDILAFPRFQVKFYHPYFPLRWNIIIYLIRRFVV